MATVRMTERLRDEIRSAASGLFTKRLDDLNNASPLTQSARVAVLDAVVDWVYAKRGLTPEMLKRVPLTMLKQDSGFHIGPLHGVDFGYVAGRKLFPWTHEFAGTWSDIPLEKLPPELPATIVWQKQFQEVIDERDKFVNRVGNIINTHSTLKSALTEWPGLWELVPQHAKDEHNRTVAKPKESTVVNPHIDELNVTLVTAKLLGE